MLSFVSGAESSWCRFLRCRSMSEATGLLQRIAPSLRRNKWLLVILCVAFLLRLGFMLKLTPVISGGGGNLLVDSSARQLPCSGFSVGGNVFRLLDIVPAGSICVSDFHHWRHGNCGAIPPGGVAESAARSGGVVRGLVCIDDPVCSLP